MHVYFTFQDELSIHNGMICSGLCVIIPENIKYEVLQLRHDGHNGIEKCQLRARTSIFWCRNNLDIDDMIRHCSTCQHNRKSQLNGTIINIEAEEPQKVIDSFFLSGKKGLYHSS